MADKKYRDLVGELVTPLNSPLGWTVPAFGGKTLLNPQDRTLIENGGGGWRALDIYLSLFKNPVAFSAWEKLIADIISRELTVTPATKSQKDRQIADYVLSIINSLGNLSNDDMLGNGSGFDTLTRAAAKALITGISPVELIWDKNSRGERVVTHFKTRDPRLVRIEYDDVTKKTTPRILTRTDQTSGVEIPARKMIIFRYWAIPTDDEYGHGLGSSLYYAVEWQKQIMAYWLMLIGKAAIPSTVGKYDEKATANPELIERFKTAIRTFGQDSSILLPPGFSIESIGINLGSADVLEKIEAKVREYIDMLIMGESSTGTQGGGSNARDQVADSIRVKRAKALSDIISSQINNTLVKWLVEAKFGLGTPAPTIWRNFAADEISPPTTVDDIDSITDFIDILTKLDQIGVRLDKAYIESRIGAPLQKAAAPPPQDDSAEEELF